LARRSGRSRLDGFALRHVVRLLSYGFAAAHATRRFSIQRAESQEQGQDEAEKFSHFVSEESEKNNQHLIPMCKATTPALKL
jgi:hypothetical protein